MFKKYHVGLLITFVFLISSTAYGSMINTSIGIGNITKISYNHIVFLDYDSNNNPIFYTNNIQEYYIIPVRVCTVGINKSLLNSMCFKINCSNYNVLISNRYINTTKNAIFFTPPNGSKKLNKTIATIYWKEDPLNYKKSSVVALYKLPNKGKIIAVYDDGSPACIMLGNKIYCGFKPDKEVLYNLLYIFMIHKLPYSLLFAIILLLLILGIGSNFQNLKKSFQDIFIKLTTLMVVGRISVNDEEKVLLNDTRREIYNYIIDNPGVHLREMAKKLNKAVSTITWHLRILEKADLIRSRKIGNKLIYYPKGMDISDLPILYLNNETSQEIFKYILRNPAHLRKIADDLDMPVETVRYNLKKMEEMNLINSKEDGNKIVYYVNNKYIQNANIS